MASQGVANHNYEETASRDDSSQAPPMFLYYARQFQLSRALERAESKTLRRLNRLVVYYFGGYLSDLDLEAWRSRATTTVEISSEQRRHHGFERSPWKRHLRFGWICRLLVVWYLASMAYLALLAYHQYELDFDKLRQMELERLGLNGSHSAALSLQLGERMARTRAALQLLGPDHAHLTVLAACFYTIVVVFTSMLCVPIYLHHRLQRPLDQCHIVRDLLDGPRERAHMRQMVEDQASRFLASGDVFHRNSTNFACASPAARRNAASMRLLQMASLAPGGREREHKRASPRLLVGEMLAAGALAPLYMLPGWVRERASKQLLLHLWLAIYNTSFFACLTAAFLSQGSGGHPGLSGAPPLGEAAAPGRWLALLAAVSPMVISTPIVVLVPPLNMTTNQEQICYIAQLRRMVRQCVVLNSALARRRAERLWELARASRQLAHSKAGSLDDRELARLERTMNSNLLFVLLHYKIFVAQLQSLRSSLGFININSLAILLTVPLITRLHQPYLSKLHDDMLTSAQVRIFAIVMGSSVLLPVNLICVPLCYMFARCKSLYKDLASLMAHMSEVKQASGGLRGPYDAHAESCLMRELCDPKRLLDQLTVRWGNVSGTYSALVRGTFWYGLVAISIMAENSQGQSQGGQLLDSLLSDPFGVYAQIKL